MVLIDVYIEHYLARQEAIWTIRGIGKTRCNILIQNALPSLLERSECLLLAEGAFSGIILGPAT